MVRRGTYILIIKLDNTTEIQIGRLGRFNFYHGYYAYIGSALNSLDGRLRRYFGKQERKTHWHIDYLLKKAKPLSAFYCENDKRIECEVAKCVNRRHKSPIKGFGASDCRCEGHLAYLERELQGTFKKSKLKLGQFLFQRWEGLE